MEEVESVDWADRGWKAIWVVLFAVILYRSVTGAEANVMAVDSIFACASGQFVNSSFNGALVCGAPAQYDDAGLWANLSNVESRMIVIEGWDVSNASLWLNASDLEARIIVLEGLNGSGASYNDTLIWENLSDHDSRVTLLEAASSTHNDSIVVLWANASNQDGRIIAIEIRNASNYFDDKFLINNGIITTNISNGNGNINITGELFVNNLTSSGSIKFIANEDSDDSITVKTISNVPYFSVIGGSAIYQTGDSGQVATYRIISSTPNLTYPTDAGIFFYPNSSVDNYMAISSLYRENLPGLTFVAAKASDRTFWGNNNKAYNLGSAALSWDNAYADDFVNTPPGLITLEKYQKKDYSRITRFNNSDIRIDSPIREKIIKSMEKPYLSYQDILDDIPINETTGETNFYTIPIPLRDKYQNNDTISTYAYLNALRGAIIEKDIEIQLLKSRLDKIEGLKQ